MLHTRRPLPFSHFCILRDFGLHVGALKDGLVVVDVPQLDDDPGVGHVVLVVVVVLPLVVHLDPEPEKEIYFNEKNPLSSSHPFQADTDPDPGFQILADPGPHPGFEIFADLDLRLIFSKIWIFGVKKGKTEL